jgi:hypothetical protein
VRVVAAPDQLRKTDTAFTARLQTRCLTGAGIHSRHVVDVAVANHAGGGLRVIQTRIVDGAVDLLNLADREAILAAGWPIGDVTLACRLTPES